MDGTIEILAVGFNVGYIILATRGNVWCWPLGILGSLLSIWLFINGKIYAEAILFVYYVIMGFYGWSQWSKQRSADDDLKIVEWNLIKHILLIMGGYFATAALYLVLKTFTDAEMPLLDSFTTVFSFIATWLTAKRHIENWVYWIGINALTVYLYSSRDFQLYAILSVVYTVMAIYGIYNWTKTLKTQKAAQ